LQKACELISSITENLLRRVAILVEFIASCVQPLFMKSKFFFAGKQAFFKYAVTVKFMAVQYTTFQRA
jgi:hypothetical protein